MRLSFQLPALAVVAIAGLAAATIPAAAALTPSGRAGASGRDETVARPSATAANTSPVWKARFKPPHWNTEGIVTAASPDGSTVFATGDGSARIGEHRSISTGFTVAYNAGTGARLWDARYVPAKKESASLAALAVSPDGSTVFATGNTYVGGSPGTYHFLTIAYNATTGARLWADSTDTLGRGQSVAVSPDGSTVYVTGFLGHVGDPTTVAYNATTGAVLWTQNAGVTISGVSVAVAPDGSAVYVTGSGKTAETAAYNAATGATLWTAPAAVRPTGLAVSPDGSTVVITGYGKPKPTGTQAYNAATGATLWTVHTTAFHPTAVAMSPDGSTVFVAGYVNAHVTVNGHTSIYPKSYGTQAYSTATGAMHWASRYHFPGKSPAVGDGESMAVSPDGAMVFVTGEAAVPTGTPGAYGTVAFDASTGAVLWAGRYHGSVSGGADSVAVSPDSSKVFVTGELVSPGPPTGYTMVTLGYNA